MTSELSELLDGSTDVLGRLVIIWTEGPYGGRQTEYRCVAEGIADDDA